jgi:hypothetical protein
MPTNNSMDQKYIKAEDGYQIQVGDIIQSIHPAFGTRNRTVHRITSKYAFVKDNELSETKFPRIYNDFNFEPFPHQKWRTVNYTVYKKRE